MLRSLSIGSCKLIDMGIASQFLVWYCNVFSLGMKVGYLFSGIAE